MKTCFLFISILFASTFTFCQTDTVSNGIKKGLEFDAFYDWTLPGHNISVNANRYYGRHAVTFGLKYFDNYSITDNQNYIFKSRFRETKFREAVGLNIGYKFNLLKDNDMVRPYVYYQLQCSYLRLIQDYTYDPYTPNPAGIVILKQTSPFYVFENTVGIGLQTRLYKNLYLNQSAGIGVASFWDPTKKVAYTGSSEWTYLLRLGITYRIN